MRIIAIVLIFLEIVGATFVPSCTYNMSQVRQYSADLDDAWNEYLFDVYGERDLKIDPYDLEFIYKHKDIELVTDRMRYPFSELTFLGPTDNYAINFLSHHPRYTYDDNSWVEVERVSTQCMSAFFTAEEFNEGFSVGSSLSIRREKPFPYGCWFHTVKGTGVWVNIGRTIVSNSRRELHKKLDLPCDGENCFTPVHDSLWCTKALEMGFDSIQTVLKMLDQRVPELLICSGNCSTQSFNSSCPPIPLRSGINASKDCKCNPTLPMINCNNRILHPGNCLCDPKFCYECTSVHHANSPQLNTSTAMDCAARESNFVVQKHRKSCALVQLEIPIKASIEVTIVVGYNILKKKIPTILFDRQNNSLSMHFLQLQRQNKLALLDIAEQKFSRDAELIIKSINLSEHPLQQALNIATNHLRTFEEGFVFSSIQNSNHIYFHDQHVRILELGNVKIGILSATHFFSDGYHQFLNDDNGKIDLKAITDILRDEAVCLRKLSSFVIYLSTKRDRTGKLLQKVSRELLGLIDLILIPEDHNNIERRHYNRSIQFKVKTGSPCVMDHQFPSAQAVPVGAGIKTLSVVKLSINNMNNLTITTDSYLVDELDG